jgi:inner membrane protein
MLRTHLAITILAMLLFLPHISHEFIFVPIILIATAIPDIDTGFSTIGKFKETRVVQFLVKHRGIFHSLSFCVVIALLFAAFLPVLALPFFLGYSLHLLADSFTIEGIKPFWPFKAVSNWKIRTGSVLETNLFVFFMILDVIVFAFIVKSVV